MPNRRALLRTCTFGMAASAMGAWPASAAAPLTVGFLLPGSKSDRGFMENGYSGLQAAQSEYGDKIKVQSIENIKDADIEQGLNDLASLNALVVGVGGQTQAGIIKVARRFPKVKFALAAGTRTDPLPNLAVYDPLQAQVAYLAGATAAMLSKTGVVSYVGGLEIPAIVDAGKEFGNGAQAINPQIKYIENYTGDFDDVAKAKETTLAAISRGADIHYHILNLGLVGLEQAARESGTHIIGSYTNYCGTDPLYVAYSITGVGFLVKYAIDNVIAGSWVPGYKPFGLQMGPKASDMIICNGTTYQKAKLEELKKKILSGEIKTLNG